MQFASETANLCIGQVKSIARGGRVPHKGVCIWHTQDGYRGLEWCVWGLARHKDCGNFLQEKQTVEKYTPQHSVYWPPGKTLLASIYFTLAVEPT